MRQPPSIDAYGGGGFRVAGLWRPGSLLIIGDEPLSWGPVRLTEVTTEHFAAVIALGALAVEFVLLGTGSTQSLPPKSIREALRSVGIGLEFMSTQSAARTYNVLASEGRRLAAALIAV